MCKILENSTMLRLEELLQEIKTYIDTLIMSECLNARLRQKWNEYIDNIPSNPIKVSLAFLGQKLGEVLDDPQNMQFRVEYNASLHKLCREYGSSDQIKLFLDSIVLNTQ